MLYFVGILQKLNGKIKTIFKIVLFYVTYLFNSSVVVALGHMLGT